MKLWYYVNGFSGCREKLKKIKNKEITSSLEGSVKGFWKTKKIVQNIKN